MPPWNALWNGSIRRSMRVAAAAGMLLVAGVTLSGHATLRAAPPVDRRAAVKQLPPPGIAISSEQREPLEAKLKTLRAAIDKLAKGKDAKAKELLPDVEIYFRAVHDALTYGEIFKVTELKTADTLLEAGLRRAEQLAAGSAPWTETTGLVVRGYVSKLDGSVQPYGLVIPESYTPKTADRYRLDIWFHGRGDTLSELNFLNDRSNKAGQFSPADTIVLHPYGRFCNGYKFAGEVDALEALDAVCARYRVDEDRIGVRGFSMGGAATWHFAVHHADRWFAANPGAGFVESAKYLNIFGSGEPIPPWYQQRLWGLYDCPPLAVNLLGCPLVAYSGELDKQKAAADLMAEALGDLEVYMTHIVGPETEHKYEPASAKEVERRMTALARGGRDRIPNLVRFATCTLKYPRMFWVEVEGLEEHWKMGTVDAMYDDDGVLLDLKGVTDLRLTFEPGKSPFVAGFPMMISIREGDAERVELEAPGPMSDRSGDVRINRDGNTWKLGARRGHELRKQHNLQGPIDDAFMEPFMFVEPTGKSDNAQVQAWVDAERSRAIMKWRQLFRGQARVKRDSDVSDDDIKNYNLVLWGDAQSNKLIERVIGKLPIGWSEQEISVGDDKFDAAGHVLAMIYPNPLNRLRYVVLNSGFTFRDGDNSSNARQTPKLPDWAVIDLSQPADEYTPGKIVAADFFNERWRIRPNRPAADSTSIDGEE